MSGTPYWISIEFSSYRFIHNFKYITRKYLGQKFRIKHENKINSFTIVSRKIIFYFWCKFSNKVQLNDETIFQIIWTPWNVADDIKSTQRFLLRMITPMIIITSTEHLFPSTSRQVFEIHLDDGLMYIYLTETDN